LFFDTATFFNHFASRKSEIRQILGLESGGAEGGEARESNGIKPQGGKTSPDKICADTHGIEKRRI
jgi:hypothetical protein